MKARSGFVSNSSSSSFVLIGKLIKTSEMTEEDLIRKLNPDEDWDNMDKDEKEDLIADLRWNGDFTVLRGADDGIPEGKMAVGRMFDAPSDDCLEFSCTELASIIDKLNNTGLEGPYQIITGTRAT